MTKPSLLDEAAVTYIVADGAMGTELRRAGLPASTPPELWNVERPDAVLDLHRRYADAGAQCITTNTFGGNRLRLASGGVDAARVSELNGAAARLAAQASGAR